MRVTRLRAAGPAAILIAAAVSVSSQQPKIGYDDTPMQPNGKWHVHDGARPQPKMVTPGASPGAAPADATVLLGGGADASAWQDVGRRRGRDLANEGRRPAVGKGMIETKAQFTDFQLHVEFATPKEVKGDGQGRGNSGVFLLGAVRGAGARQLSRIRRIRTARPSAMYGQYPPLVNASRPPGEWQAYDIIFTAPRFTASGTLDKPAVVTVIHNGIVVHNATAYLGPTAHKVIEPYVPASAKGPIRFQDHGNPVHFRNIWIRPIKGYDET